MTDAPATLPLPLPTIMPPAPAVDGMMAAALDSPDAPLPLLLMDVLTDELLLQVLGWLEAEGLAQAALACKALARLCRDDELWTPLCRQAWRGKQNAHAFADALQPGEARNAYGLVLRESLKDVYTTLVKPKVSALGNKPAACG